MIKEVLLVFKTHLDIGFTDFAANVKDKYIREYIPAAIDLGYRLKNTDTPFVWTVGSWLIYEALKTDDGKLERAIKDGIITWHGMPFTVHSEVMSEKLFAFGLGLSAALDRRFGHRTIAAKMSDVPGHTIGIVPHLARAGIEFLHIGVNGATPVPAVPPLFRWQCGEESVTVMYKGGEYGGMTEIGDFCLAFGHTLDNKGPQSAGQIQDFYAEIRKKYPGAKVRAATLDDVAERLRRVPMPTVTKDIGDTWIHGVGTDPLKVSMYRDVLRAAERRGTDGLSLEDDLLLVPEHTWGYDQKKSFKNDADWYPTDFDKRKEERKKIEASWEEQRGYVRSAAEKLGVRCANASPVLPPDTAAMEECEIPPTPVSLSYQLFDREDYARYRREYLQLDVDWAIWDFTKVGLPAYTGFICEALPRRAFRDGKKTVVLYSFDEERAGKWGLPRFYFTQRGEEAEICMLDKKATRFPQAIFLKWKDLGENWKMRKLGQWIVPEEVIDGKLISATDGYVRNDTHEIYSYDAPLVCPFGRRLLEYGTPCGEQNLYFNLYNNIWNTNFPMWYGDNIRFRFRIRRI